MMYIIKFLHLICGTTILGIVVASFFYISRSIRLRDNALILYSLKASYFGDALILLCIIIQFASAAFLVSAGHFTLDIPWIRVAHIAFGSVTLLWFAILLIKYFKLSKPKIPTFSLSMFYILNILFILIFTIIIHDAITHSTWFGFLME